MTANLLLHFEGDWSDSAEGRTSTVYGTPTVSTAQSRFGGSSAYFPSNGSEVEYGGTLVNTNDFTVEMWVRLGDNTSAKGFMWSSTSGTIYLGTTAAGLLYTTYSGTLYTGSTVVSANVWHHVALCRMGGYVKLFLDGTVQRTYEYGSSSGSLGMRIGNNGGYVDEVRVINGTGLYYRAFTPPTAPLTTTHPLPPFEVTDYTVRPLARHNVRSVGTVRQKAKHLPLWMPTVLTKPKLLDRSSDFGNYRIVGTTKVAGTPNLPVKQRVMLLEERAGRPIAQVWSDPVTGAYAFNNITNAQTYTVVSFDHQGLFDAVIADNLQATPMP